MSGFIYMPIRVLSKQIRSCKISPVELTKSYLDRLEKYGPRLNCVVTVTHELALKQARRAEREIKSGRYRGLLHGVPYGVKDLLATNGIPTTWGAEPLRSQVFEYDATVIKRLEDAGGVLCAKLSMIELAGGAGYRQPNACLTGPPKNPWNKEYWTGGSSSGSGAAVSAGLIPFAIGSETMGSIIGPSNNCGVSGLRPTYGRVSRAGAMALSWTLDKLGPMCLTADDVGIVLEAIAGPDPYDYTTIPEKWRYKTGKPKEKFKLGMLKGVLDDAQPEVKENFDQALVDLKKIASIQEIDIPGLPYEAVARVILNAEAASAFEDMVESGKISGLTAPEDRWGPYARTAYLATDYLRALRLRGKIARIVDEAIERFDAWVAPTAKKAATSINEEFRKVAPATTKEIMGAIGNVCGLPSISVPNGFTPSGLPTGIQFMGRSYDENIVLAIARAYQSITSWHTRHPKVD